MEPFFLRPANSRLLRIQLEQLGMPVTDEEWRVDPSEHARARFARLMAPRLAGRRRALKEVVEEEHDQVLRELRPGKLVICVRDIVDVALSFFEKHPLQDNLDRFSDDCVIAYCVRESAALVWVRNEAEQQGLPYHVIRYENFTRDGETRAAFERFFRWSGGGTVATGLVRMKMVEAARLHGCGRFGANSPARRSVSGR